MVVFCSVNGDKWEVMFKSDCEYNCQRKCEQHKYKSAECVDQGGLFPKYSDCHCWGQQFQSLDGDDYYD